MIGRIFLVLTGVILFMLGNGYMEAADRRRHDIWKPTVIGAAIMILGGACFIKGVWP